jgi:hypothetical protein
MLTDKPEIYQTGLVEAAKRTLPVLFTRPGQVYEVDPSRIVNLGKVDTEVSGGGPRSFDADQLKYCHLYLTEINREFERWMVLGRTGEGNGDLGFGDLEFGDIGLKVDADYLVFEFWTKKFIGVFREKLDFPAIDTTYNCQLFCIREKQGYPQVLATNRHISCGGIELEDVNWSGNVLSGTSKIVGNDRYDIYIYEPDGFIFKEFTCEGAAIRDNKKDGEMRVISLIKEESGVVTWKSSY